MKLGHQLISCLISQLSFEWWVYSMINWIHTFPSDSCNFSPKLDSGHFGFPESFRKVEKNMLKHHLPLLETLIKVDRPNRNPFPTIHVFRPIHPNPPSPIKTAVFPLDTQEISDVFGSKREKTWGYRFKNLGVAKCFIKYCRRRS